MEQNRTPIQDGSTSADSAGVEPSFLSPYIGVRITGAPFHWAWVAEITKDGRYYYLGQFPNPYEAALVHDAKARELSGPLARLNFNEASR